MHYHLSPPVFLFPSFHISPFFLPLLGANFCFTLNSDDPDILGLLSDLSWSKPKRMSEFLPCFSLDTDLIEENDNGMLIWSFVVVDKKCHIVHEGVSPFVIIFGST